MIANAGHPPPLVRRADGTVEVVDGEPGLLLGAGGGERTPIRVPFREGDLLLGYTDGLVERRDEDIETGVNRLVAACAEAAADDLFVWLADVVLAARDTSPYRSSASPSRRYCVRRSSSRRADASPEAR